MNKVHIEALELRLAGHSYNEINKLLGIPKSTLSSWFANIVLSKKASERLELRKRAGTEVLISRNKAQTAVAKDRALKTQQKSQRDVEMMEFSKKELLMVGVALYWGEGYKKTKYKNGRILYNHPVQLTNSDPILARAFVRFLNEVMAVPLEKISVCLRLYKNIDKTEALNYWLKATNLPASCYRGTTYLVSKASRGKRPSNRLPFGTLEIRINDTQLFHRLMGYLEGVKSKI